MTNDYFPLEEGALAAYVLEQLVRLKLSLGIRVKSYSDKYKVFRTFFMIHVDLGVNIHI